jgi:hypothetical protein
MGQLQQMFALQRMATQLDPAGSALRAWQRGRDYCLWPGVTCDPNTGDVQKMCAPPGGGHPVVRAWLQRA